MTVINFGNRLAALRKQRGLTQQAVADALTAHVIQIHRYEAGTSQPSLDVRRNLALALNTSPDSLLINPDERGPERLASDCARKPSTSSSTTSRSLILAMIVSTPLRHQVRPLNAG